MRCSGGGGAHAAARARRFGLLLREPGDEFGQRDAQGLADRLQFDEVEPALAAFVLAHERLRASQPRGQFGLAQAGVLAQLDQQGAQPFGAACVIMRLHNLEIGRVAEYPKTGYPCTGKQNSGKTTVFRRRRRAMTRRRGAP